jgi:hypothetical protein
VVSLLFNSWKLFSHASDHSNLVLFLSNSVIGFAILEKFSMNL